MNPQPHRAVVAVLLTLALAHVAPAPAHAISSRTLITPTGAAASDFFGNSVSDAGDVNGDGCADVIVGAYTNDVGGADAGRAYVYYGGPGADAVADLALRGDDRAKGGVGEVRGGRVRPGAAAGGPDGAASRETCSAGEERSASPARASPAVAS